MPWPSWLGRRDKEAEAAAAEKAAEDAAAAEAAARRALALRAIADFFGIPPSSSTTSRPEAPPPTATPTAVSWDESLAKTNWQHYSEPQAWLPPALAVGAALGFSAFYRSYLRRIPGTNYIQPRYFRRRSLFGKVTSVGDGDNFHLFHTPGGRLAGWGWLRHVPTLRKDLRGKTIPVRIAGVDAPEGAHFGRPAQPYSGEALEFLTQYLLGRHVRAYLYRRDQYDRVVARVVVRRFWFFKHDVGVEMLKRGLATCYEARTGAEFGGREAAYRIAEAEAKARKKGMWSGGAGRANETATASSNVKPGEVETPRAYKTRMAAMDAANGTVAGTTKAPPSFTSHKPAHPSSAGKK